jgi:hypothetical protein|tara:strand:- start:776 stop:973 length:198 start_codon:yes stop_codon:yes gene_type:complete
MYSDFVYPVQTKKMQENNQDPRVQVSELLKGDKRLEGESFNEYKTRLKVEKQLVKDYLRGYIIEN